MFAFDFRSNMSHTTDAKVKKCNDSKIRRLFYSKLDTNNYYSSFFEYF